MAKKDVIGTVLMVFGTLLFVGGFYLLPIGTDAYLYFFVEKVAHGDWLLGSFLGNAVAILIAGAGYLLLRAQGVKPGFKKEKGARK